MQHRGTKRGKPTKLHGYRWWNRETGAVDLLELARDACKGLPLPTPETIPAWLEGFPTQLDQPKPADLARIDARARTAALRAMAD